MKTNTIRERIKVPKVPTIYIDYEYDEKINLIGVVISRPTSFDNTALGELIDVINASLALNIEDITISRVKIAETIDKLNNEK